MKVVTALHFGTSCTLTLFKYAQYTIWGWLRENYVRNVILSSENWQIWCYAALEAVLTFSRVANQGQAPF